MFKLNSEYYSRMLTGIGCLAAALWLVVHTYNWIHATWFQETNLTLPVMAALMAVMLVATGMTTITQLNRETFEPEFEDAELAHEQVYEQ